MRRRSKVLYKVTELLDAARSKEPSKYSKEALSTVDSLERYFRKPKGDLRANPLGLYRLNDLASETDVLKEDVRGVQPGTLEWD